MAKGSWLSKLAGRHSPHSQDKRGRGRPAPELPKGTPTIKVEQGDHGLGGRIIVQRGRKG